MRFADGSLRHITASSSSGVGVGHHLKWKRDGALFEPLLCRKSAHEYGIQVPTRLIHSVGSFECVFRLQKPFGSLSQQCYALPGLSYHA